MKLIDQITLVFTAGRSEKVFEIDLCEVAAGKFVVNYRYGRRGGNLKDKTKTLAPVSEAEARVVYAKLIESKQAQGYASGAAHAVAPIPQPAEPVQAIFPPEAPAPAPAPAPASAAPSRVASSLPVTDPRHRAIIARLARGTAASGNTSDSSSSGRTSPMSSLFRRRSRQPSSGPGNWSLDRAIWRAGELRIAAAVPLLGPLIGTGGEMRDYCIAWAIGVIGEPSGVEQLRSMMMRTRDANVQRIAGAALVQLAGGDERSGVLQGLAIGLPRGLKELALSGTAEAVTEALVEHLSDKGEPWADCDPESWAALETLYLLNTASTRPGVLRAVSEAPMAPPAFQRLRHIFKVAEMRRDGRVFGAVARRFATQRAMFRNDGGYGASVPNRAGERRWMSDDALKSMMASARPTAAYGSLTRWYLRKRVWRTLKRLGDSGDASFVPMAVGCLLAFSDDDAVAPRESYDWNTDSTVQYGGYAGFWAFNHLLYTNSSRYVLRGRSFAMLGRAGATPSTREEAFPSLWDQQPAGLMQLLLESRSLPVHEFAVRAMRGLPHFVAALPAEAIAALLGQTYEVTVRLAFESAARRYRPGTPEQELRTLAVAVANCALADLRSEAFTWLRESPQLLSGSADAVVALLTSTHDDARAFVNTALASFAGGLSPGARQAMVGRIIARLMAAQPGDGDSDGEEALATDLASVLKSLFAAEVNALGREVVTDLARHELAAVQLLAGSVLLSTAQPNPTPEALEALLESKHAEVQVVGVRVLGKLGEDVLLAREDLLWSLTVHKDGVLREAARPIIGRLAHARPEFGGKFLQMLVASLLRRRLPEGADSHVVKVLRDDFGPTFLTQIPEDVVWRLLRSKSTAAQELGGILLPQHLDPQTVQVSQLVELANHQVLSVRQAAWAMYQAILEANRLKPVLTQAIRVLDSDWEDSRVWAFKFFEEHLAKGDLTPLLLVSICDSVRSDVQRFGRRLITQHFDESVGDKYLLMLSEHPSSDVQLFVTNFLDGYAAENAENLAQLEPYFIRVLSGVNRGRDAKKRLHRFLRAEAIGGEAQAKVVARVMARQCATAAVEDRAEAVETLVAISRRWSNIDVPVVHVTPPSRAQEASA